MGGACPTHAIASIYTGNYTTSADANWTVKRCVRLPDPERPHPVFRLAERLNIGVIAGLCAGIDVYFLSNRLLPLGMASRVDWEINAMFVAWGGLFLWIITRPVKRAWIEALAMCAILNGLVPIVSAFTTVRGLPRFGGDLSQHQ